MKPEDIFKLELLGYFNKNEFDKILVRLLEIRDPELEKIRLTLNLVRKHGHGQLIINVGKGSVNQITQTLSYLLGEKIDE